MRELETAIFSGNMAKPNQIFAVEEFLDIKLFTKTLDSAIKVVEELQAENNKLRQESETLKREVGTLKREVEKLKNIIRPDEIDVHNINRRIEILARKIEEIKAVRPSSLMSMLGLAK